MTARSSYKKLQCAASARDAIGWCCKAPDKSNYNQMENLWVIEGGHAVRHGKEYEQKAEKSPDADSGHRRTSGGTAFYPGVRICENGIVHDPISGDWI